MKLRARKENMEKVIAALESGEYQQVTGRLRAVRMDGTVTMCATGVALEVGRLNGVPWSWKHEHGSGPWDGGEAFLAFNDWLWEEDCYLGRTLTIPLKGHPDGEALPDTIIDANDRGESFWTIAQRLRETYLKEDS